ncbi:hypothetical protein IA69_15345 [Massilia sp. JS1662]|nr:hypothetical protein IA69_15345 [Massilia sp. JS1662]
MCTITAEYNEYRLVRRQTQRYYGSARHTTIRKLLNRGIFGVPDGWYFILQRKPQLKRLRLFALVRYEVNLGVGCPAMKRQYGIGRVLSVNGDILRNFFSF